MTKRNELLDKDIQERIDNARFEKGDEEKNKQSLFYLIVVVLVTLSVLFPLLRHLF
ncbi:hypothetical protein [Streptococcus iniae]|uniref:hypothetical protein n=1 Tax=Streptococcus iniae TaxID=1346 RepID=UPI000283083E|nr:hypothetical protein [Streptococcus iniae]AGM98258.1 hypothetical protein K710_0478 [Streptococcus iniae SF1]ASL34291.1 hypothetical protein QMA0248_0473 [Streptococcus iniae]ATX39239.1 hypothetical protein CTW00_01057 [Streptococcus iniae]EKB51377.1 hypothetical protein A0G_1283 [Streptococcus iniae 9117]ELY5747042.1 hypothetical protein [Streptococcus iniae]